jgi:predicted XRE-type DNA-binding protein
MTAKQRFSSVWDALEDTPQQAASMRARSELMLHLTAHIQEKNLAQASAAALFGVTQPRISDLMRGKINLFSLDALIDMAAIAGMSPTVKLSTPKLAKRARTRHAAPPEPLAM